MLRTLLAAVVLSGFALAASAAGRWLGLTEPSFQHLTREQGLPNEIANAVAEDGAGFLWIGTYGGLARWDGYHFRVYRADPRQPGALPDSLVQTLHGDAAGRLWVGTTSAGVVRFDPATERFVRYPVGADGLSHVSVHAIADDGAGARGVGTERGLSTPCRCRTQEGAGRRSPTA